MRNMFVSRTIKEQGTRQYLTKVPKGYVYNVKMTNGTQYCLLQQYMKNKER